MFCDALRIFRNGGTAYPGNSFGGVGGLSYGDPLVAGMPGSGGNVGQGYYSSYQASGGGVIGTISFSIHG